MSRPQERSLQAVPAWLMITLILAIGSQVYLQQHVENLPAKSRSLPEPPSQQAATIASLNTPTFAAQVMMLWLQSFDVQPGISLSFKELNYVHVRNWLRRILTLNPKGQYPLLSASRVYAEVRDPTRQRLMLDFVAEEFERDPSKRWPWLAHAVYVAKHRLVDIDYALVLSDRLAKHQHNDNIPAWARQMKIFVLEDMGELESAKVLLGGLLESGQVTDPHEQWFLSNRLAELELALRRRDSEPDRTRTSNPND